MREERRKEGIDGSRGRMDGNSRGREERKRKRCSKRIEKRNNE